LRPRPQRAVGLPNPSKPLKKLKKTLDKRKTRAYSPWTKVVESSRK
jgi:hypothetical protein